MIEPLPLLKNKKEWFYLGFAFSILFISNIFIQYLHYKDFKDEEIFITKAKIENIYIKKQYKILKLSTKDFTFFTKDSSNLPLHKLNNIDITIVTNNITFLDFIKSFYAPSFNITILYQEKNLFYHLYKSISTQHHNQKISELFNALFLAIPTSKDIKQLCSTYGVSHLIAISGFHLGVLSFVSYWIIYVLYINIKKRYFPYRNTRFDIMIIVSFILLGYLLFLGLVPSLLRAYIMFIFGLFLYRCNIKLISFQTLLLVVLFIISLFPKLLFSLSLWFSIAGVFYIFLFIKYFKNLNKIINFILFNIWIFLAMNPITHYFFSITSFKQLYSPIFTLLFTIFYPLELFLHLIYKGDIFDNIINLWINNTTNYTNIQSSIYFIIIYLGVSFLSIKSKKWFYILNIMFVGFNIWLYSNIL